MFVTRAVKVVLHIFNTLILIYGLFLVVCGTMIVQDIKTFRAFLESKMFWLPYFLSANGVLTVALAVIGFWANMRQNYKLLFLISTVIVLVIELALVTWIATGTGDPKFSEQLRSKLLKSFNGFLTVKSDQKSWSLLQRKLHCCGINNAKDWNKIYSNNLAPTSCCINVADYAEQPSAACRIIDPKAYYTVGCHSVLFKRINDHWAVVSVLAAAAATLQTIVFSLSVIMAVLVKRGKSFRDRQ